MRGPPHQFLVVLALAHALALGAAPAARAQDGEPPASEERAPSSLDLLDVRTPRFGEADSVWVSGGVGVADDRSSSVDAYAWTAISWFAVEDVEMAIELGAWHHNQPGGNAESLSVSNVLRWHFVNTGGWTLYGEIGMGILASTDNVPNGGSGFNFLPRAGGGVTRRLTETSRLQIGLRWHHISNARIVGEERNASRDAAMFYAGIIFAF